MAAHQGPPDPLRGRWIEEKPRAPELLQDKGLYGRGVIHRGRDRDTLRACPHHAPSFSPSASAHEGPMREEIGLNGIGCQQDIFQRLAAEAALARIFPCSFNDMKALRMGRKIFCDGRTRRRPPGA